MVKNFSISKLEITVSLVTKLIAEQFPQWAHLPIKPVEVSGWDNRTFRFGETMLVRLPNAERYAAQVIKEQTWLPILRPHLSFQIPQPIAMGKPSVHYPWSWSIYKWIEGKSVNLITLQEINDLHLFARQCAQFLKELHKIDTTNGPIPGEHNFYRGGSLSAYDAETRSALSYLRDVIDSEKALKVWEKALSSTWSKAPVWVHGDFNVGNILVRDGQLVAVIDFGGMSVGDPACDLVLAWTFLTQKSGKVFRSSLDLDLDTWMRARGWALWKALITLEKLENKMSPEALEQKQIVTAIFTDYD